MAPVQNKMAHEYVQRVTKEAKEILDGIPQKVGAIDNLITKLFPLKSPSAAGKIFAGSVSVNAALNADVIASIDTVRDEVFDAIAAMQKIERWIQLSVPNIEDGNNFGVEVQRSVLQQVSGSKIALQTGFDSFPDYNWQRGLAFEKFAKKISIEKSKNTGSTSSKGGKDGEEVKDTTGNSEKETESQSNPIPDFMTYIAAIDVKWYFNSKRILECVRDHYAFSYDIVHKNNAKLIEPRGQSQTSNMF